MAVEKAYRFEGPDGPASLVDLFEGRRQLIVYRFWYQPDVTTYAQAGGAYPERACVGCSMVADQVAHPAHLNARDTTLAFVSRAPQAEIQGLKERMGWGDIPWYSLTDDFDKDFGVGEWHGTNAFIRDGDEIFRTYFIDARGDEAMGQHLGLPRPHRARPAGGVEGFARGRRRRTSGGTTTTRTARTHERTPMAATDPVYDKQEQYERVRDGLLPGESVVAVYDCIGAGTGFVGLTDQRVILQDNSFVGKKVALTSVPYSRVHAVSFVANKSLLGKFASTSEVSILVSGEQHECEFRGHDKARLVHDTILARMLSS
jgi:hypothetical protein